MPETHCKPPFCTCGEHILADDPGPPPFDWCYIEDCDHHNSPTGPPNRIEPTSGEILDHQDKQARWAATHKPHLDSVTEDSILELLLTSETPREIYAAYRIAELAGLCWWSNKEREWQWIDKH